MIQVRKMLKFFASKIHNHGSILEQMSAWEKNVPVAKRADAQTQSPCPPEAPAQSEGLWTHPPSPFSSLH